MSRKANPNDPRSQRTRRALRNALVDLIPHKGYDAITVQDITERAGLNRATFYLHFHDKADLLAASTAEVHAELSESASPRAFTLESLINEETPTPIRVMLAHVAEYADFYRVMLGPEGVPWFSAQVEAYAESVVREWVDFFIAHMPPNGAAAPVWGQGAGPDRDMMVRFLASGYIGVIRLWLAGEELAPQGEIARQIRDLSDAIFAMLGGQRPFRAPTDQD